MARIKRKYKIKPLYVLDGNWTKICNTMFKYIPHPYDFKVYCYLCYRYNNEYQYAFPSLSTIAADTCISVKRVQQSIKWLEEQGFIYRYKRVENEWQNNCYYVRYVEITDEMRKEEQETIVKTFEELIGDDFEAEIEVERYEEEENK